MKKLHQGQTGPKTESGKKVVSKNAQKTGIFTQGYLPTENVTQKQNEFEQLCNEWNGYSVGRQMILRSIEQASLGIERMMINEKIILEGSLQSLDIANEFCSMADIDPLRATALPKWFFSADEDDANKQFALSIDNIWREANRLKMQFTDSIIPEIPTLFPNLYRYVVGVKTGNVSFINCLSERCKQSTVALNLAVLMNQILEKYPHHMLWASDPMRYQTLINAVRARRMRDAVDLDKSTRHGTNFQNRILKGFQMLALMDQYEKQDAILMSEPNALPMQDIDQADDQKDKEGDAK
jgi:hypothetical protein